MHPTKKRIMKHFHELETARQEQILDALTKIIEGSKTINSIEKKLKKFWSESNVEHPEKFQMAETYADFYDEDYFGVLRSSLHEYLIDASKDNMYELWDQEDEGKNSPDCPGSENERNFYRYGE